MRLSGRCGAGRAMTPEGGRNIMEEYLQEPPKGPASRDGIAAVAVTALTIALIVFLVTRIV